MKENFLNKIPLKVYRNIRKEKELIDEYLSLKKTFSKDYAKICYKANKAVYKYGEAEKTYELLRVKDEYILNYIENKCADIIEKYCNASFEDKTQCTPGGGGGQNIWVYWWQGEEHMPDIVKACVKSIRDNSSGHKVVLVDRNNYSDFVDISDIVVKKHDDGIVGHAHFSDIVRSALLANYGGMWIDATVFISQPIPERVFERTFYTAKSVNEKAFYYSKSRWVSYFLSGNKAFPLFSFVRDMLTTYWERSDAIIDYLLIDYVFDIAYRNIPAVKREIDSLEDNNLLRGRLMSEINNPYDKELFDALKTGETFLSKLSWRYGNPQEKTRDGKITNYGYILNL